MTHPLPIYAHKVCRSCNQPSPYPCSGQTIGGVHRRCLPCVRLQTAFPTGPTTTPPTRSLISIRNSPAGGHGLITQLFDGFAHLLSFGLFHLFFFAPAITSARVILSRGSAKAASALFMRPRMPFFFFFMPSMPVVCLPPIPYFISFYLSSNRHLGLVPFCSPAVGVCGGVDFELRFCQRLRSAP